MHAIRQRGRRRWCHAEGQSAALGEYDEAVEHIRKASELEPKRAYYRRSVVRLESMRDELG